MKHFRDTPDGLAEEHVALMQAYGRAQSHCNELITAQAAQIKQLQAELMRTRAQVIMRDTALAQAREDAAALANATQGLSTRVRLASRVAWLTERLHSLLHERTGHQWRTEQANSPLARQSGTLADLRQKAVLCIGQDASGTTVAQQAIEHAGGRFLHHAGEEGADAAMLEASLVAADLVICQTGCVSHDAYWRVQDHCRRTGKQCVLVDQPHALQFVRRVEDLFVAVPEGA
jgi:hypothetical protein